MLVLGLQGLCIHMPTQFGALVTPVDECYFGQFLVENDIQHSDPLINIINVHQK